ncbi:hypothetical protein MMC25_003152 [Agyrium rufum]|nr:hypothetical protein [Agyrium rufum]
MEGGPSGSTAPEEGLDLSSGASSSAGPVPGTDTPDFRVPQRRGHSDGDVLLVGSNKRQPPLPTAPPPSHESWQDFLRQTPSSRREELERFRADVRRNAMVNADRMRRYHERGDGLSRTRSATATSTQSQGPHMSQEQVRRVSAGQSQFNPSLNSSSNPDANRHFRPSVPLSSSPFGMARYSGEIVLPRWQPDSEVSECPICHNAFTLFYRKHHCRKCGRVVCGSCSPHRITIPRQFIVHPPQDPSTMSASNNHRDVIDLTGDDEGERVSMATNVGAALDPALGGGQEVRLCNPCVPDPNPLPPPSYSPSDHHHFTPSISRSTNSQDPLTLPPSATSNQASSHRYYDYPPTLHPTQNQRRQTLGSLYDTQPSRRPPYDLIREGSTTQQSEPRDIHAAPPSRHTHANLQSLLPPLPALPNYGSVPHPTSITSNTTAPPHLHHRHHGHRTSASTSYVPRSMLDITSPFPYRPASPHTPVSVLREEDECPICHLALPPKGPDGSETAREEHVASCIETHFSMPSTSQARRSSQSQGQTQPTPHPSTAIDAAVMANSATPAQAGGQARPRSESSSAQHQQPPVKRRAGMLVYHASEKDCLGEDGQAQECVICFEDFAVGDEMGRLECLCKYHRSCIRSWWDTKGTGFCPVHQGGI